VIGLELSVVGGDPLAQRRHLAGDGVVARLALGRDARVERDLTVGHAYLRPSGPARPLAPDRCIWP
jgi:hypothetical protein